MTELRIDGLTAGYGEVTVIRDLDMHVAAGEVVALLGPNGAGKSTTLLAAAGVIPVASGRVLWDGRELSGPLHRRARHGLGFIGEGRSVITTLNVSSNLRIGRAQPKRALELFPELEPLLSRRGGLLSGGEQQYLALARALSCGPRVLLIDELSLGLAPLLVERLLNHLREAAAAGTAILLVEQHARLALKWVDRAYVLRNGEIVLEGTAADVGDRFDEVEHAYLARRADAGAGAVIAEES